MLSVVPLRPNQLDELFDPYGTLRSVRTVSKVFEGRKTAKDSLFHNWLRAAFVAQYLDNNADSTSQLQTEPDFPATFTAEQSATFYTDLAIGFGGWNPQCPSPIFRPTTGTRGNRRRQRPHHQTTSHSGHDQ
jgi:hypothetical protein